MQIADHYRAEIQAGRLRSGDPVPSARTIAQTFGTSINTAVAGLRVLADDGLIERVPGHVFYVK